VKLYDLPIVSKRQHVDGNHLVQTSKRKGAYKLVVENGVEIALTKMLSKYVHRTLELIPRTYLVTSISQPQTIMTPSNWSMFVNKIGWEGKRFGPDRF
jgi:hypothetical protein